MGPAPAASHWRLPLLTTYINPSGPKHVALHGDRAGESRHCPAPRLAPPPYAAEPTSADAPQERRGIDPPGAADRDACAPPALTAPVSAAAQGRGERRPPARPEPRVHGGGPRVSTTRPGRGELGESEKKQEARKIPG